MNIGLIQQAYQGDIDSTISHTKAQIKHLASQGADLVVLQELHHSHYFCISENPENFELAEDFTASCNMWSDVAKENNIVLVTSLFEKRTTGLYHNTSVVFERDGSMAGKYRKMHIPEDPGFHEKFYFTPGDMGFEPIQTSVGKLGVLICWDQWYPEATRLMALKGAEILIYPTAIGWFDEDTQEEKQRQLDAWMAVQRGHAVANGIPVVTVNRVGFEKDVTGTLDGIVFWGNSFAYGAQGEELVRLGEDAQNVVIEIDLKRSEEVRRMWPFLRDRRIEYFSELSKRFID